MTGERISAISSTTAGRASESWRRSSGARSTRGEYVGLVAAAYASVVAGILLGYLPPAAAVALLTGPQALGLCRGIWTHQGAAVLTQDLRDTAKLHQRAGLLLAAALLFC